MNQDIMTNSDKHSRNSLYKICILLVVIAIGLQIHNGLMNQKIPKLEEQDRIQIEVLDELPHSLEKRSKPSRAGPYVEIEFFELSSVDGNSVEKNATVQPQQMPYSLPYGDRSNSDHEVMCCVDGRFDCKDFPEVANIFHKNDNSPNNINLRYYKTALFDRKKRTNPRTSKYKTERDKCQIGESITVEISPFDAYKEAKLYGGDYWIVRMVSKVDDTSVIPGVVKFRQNEYRMFF